MEKLAVKDHKRVQLQDLQKDMKGINPKLSIYKRMERECESITRELEALGATNNENIETVATTITS